LELRRICGYSEPYLSRLSLAYLPLIFRVGYRPVGNFLCIRMVQLEGFWCISVIVWFLCLIIKLSIFSFSMMIKRIVILSFCMLFLVSTTGLPITIHFCKMLSSVSVNKNCSMCGMDRKHENTSQGTSIKKPMSSCCHTETFDNNVKDNFLSFSIEMNVHIISTAMICPAECSFCSFIGSIQFTDTSPPGLISNNLYLFNSILLI
jgi:hypothetical protein